MAEKNAQSEAVKILELINRLHLEKFTGKIIIELDMRDGGIGKITQTLRNVMR